MSGSLLRQRISTNGAKLRQNIFRPRVDRPEEFTLSDWVTLGGGGDGGGGDGGRSWVDPFGNGDWKLLTPHEDPSCEAQMLEGFGWAVVNSEKLWSGGDWDEEYAKTQTSSMCELYGAQLAAHLQRRLEERDEQKTLERVRNKHATVALLQELRSEYLSQQSDENRAQRGNTE